MFIFIFIFTLMGRLLGAPVVRAGPQVHVTLFLFFYFFLFLFISFFLTVPTLPTDCDTVSNAAQ